MPLMRCVKRVRDSARSTNVHYDNNKEIRDRVASPQGGVAERHRRRHPRFLLVALVLGVGALLVACGGGAGDSGGASSGSNVINGIPVPPDPGASGTVTVAGIDTDNNGIRDDIDRFIATKYGTNATSVKAARTAARAVQRVLITDGKNKSAALVALQDSG